MNIKCLIIGHEYSNWKFIKPIGRYEEKLVRVCDRCGKKEIYIGLTSKCIENNSREPYIYKS